MAADPYKYFRVEARELVEQLGQGALDLEKNAPSPDVIAHALRLAHTLKGAARVVKLPAIAERAHGLEDALTALREMATPAPREQVDGLLDLIDQIGRLVSALPDGPQSATLSAPAPASAPVTAAEGPVHAFKPDPEDLDRLANGITEAQAWLGGFRSDVDEGERIAELIDLVDVQLARLRPRGSMYRTEVDRVTPLVDEVRMRFTTLARRLEQTLDRFERELRQVSDAANQLRLVPAKAIFHFLERAVRDVAQTLGKGIVFEGRGGDVRVDGEMLATVQTALLQVVRNAAAHGIEAHEHERLALGKPAQARITVSVSREDQWLVFACTDDGRGVDFDAVRQKFMRRGHVPGGQTLDDDAVVRLLLKGGISTSGTITPLAGRGVGLDVVREAAGRLGGEVAMRTKAHRGTTVEFKVPFSMASFEALLVDAADVAAAVPLHAVRGAVRVAPGAVVQLPQGEGILYDGVTVPFVPLAWLVGAAGQSAAGRDAAVSAVVVDAGGGAAALAVDRIRGSARVVTRPLPTLAPALPVVAGTSIDTSGDLRLILDPTRLVAEAARARAPRLAAVSERPSVLVVDDSLTTRMLEQSILESAGYDVALASSGEEGLSKARAGAYALFLVDVEMPGMDGFAFIEQVRADPSLRRIPAILVTSRSSPEDRRRGEDVGAQDYIVKGEFHQGVLLDRIRTLVH
jgi:two-component system, chemotaxis family, sensor kinase CheA